jgi:hypothetical protein
MMMSRRISLVAAALVCLAGTALVSATPQPDSTALYLDEGVYLADDGAGTSACLTQGGDGLLWVVVGNDQAGYTYQFLASTGLDQNSWVQTTQYAGDWYENEDGTYDFYPAQAGQQKPAEPPLIGPPVPAKPVITMPMPGGATMQIFDDGTVNVTLANGTIVTIVITRMVPSRPRLRNPAAHHSRSRYTSSQRLGQPSNEMERRTIININTVADRLSPDSVMFSLICPAVISAGQGSIPKCDLCRTSYARGAVHEMDLVTLQAHWVLAAGSGWHLHRYGGRTIAPGRWLCRQDPG